jgi:hypothetical protein
VNISIKIATLTLFKQNARILLFILITFSSIQVTAQVKIGDNTTEISSFSLLELESVNKGLLLPRMNTEQRDQAFNQGTPEGMVIFNTDLQMLQYLFSVKDETGKAVKKVWNLVGEEVYSMETPPAPNTGDLFYNHENKILYVWDEFDQLWIPLNFTQGISASEQGVSDPTSTSTETTNVGGGGFSSSLIEVLTGDGIPSSTSGTTKIDEARPGLLYVNTRNGDLYAAADTNSDGISDIWDKINSSGGGGGGSSTNTNNQTLTLNGTTLSITDGNSVDLSGLGGTGTDQNLSVSGNNLSISNGNTVRIPEEVTVSTVTPSAFTFTESPTAGDLFVETTSSTLWIFDSNNNWVQLSNSGSNLYSADGTIATDRIISFSSSNTLRFSGTASNTVIFETNTRLNEALLDSDGDVGLPGQVLSSTGAASNTVNWIFPGGLATLQTGDYTLAGEGTLFVRPSGAVTITLPDPTGKDGRRVTVKRADAYTTGNILTVRSAAGATLDKAISNNLNMSYQGYTYEAFGGEWHIIQRF